MENIKLPEKAETKEPKISLDFFLAWHASGEDLSGLEDKIKEADVIMLEGAGWNKQTIEGYQGVSDGVAVPEEGNEAAIDRLLKIIANTHKPIELIDIPENNSLWEEYSNLMVEGNKLKVKASNAFLRGNLQEAIVLEKEATELFSSTMAKREEFIKNKIKESIQKLSFEFSDHDNIRVLVYLGIAHAPIFHDLRKENEVSGLKIEIKRSKNKLKSNIQSIFGEIYQRKYWDKTIDDITYARLFLEDMICSVLATDTISRDKVTAISREITDSFSMDDLSTLCKELSAIPDEDKKYDIIDKALDKKGFVLPKYEDEVENYVNNFRLKVGS